MVSEQLDKRPAGPFVTPSIAGSSKCCRTKQPAVVRLSRIGTVSSNSSCSSSQALQKRLFDHRQLRRLDKLRQRRQGRLWPDQLDHLHMDRIEQR